MLSWFQYFVFEWVNVYRYVVAHVGLTTAGTVGAATSLTLEGATSAVQAMVIRQ